MQRFTLKKHYTLGTSPHSKIEIEPLHRCLVGATRCLENSAVPCWLIAIAVVRAQVDATCSPRSSVVVPGIPDHKPEMRSVIPFR